MTAAAPDFFPECSDEEWQDTMVAVGASVGLASRPRLREARKPRVLPDPRARLIADRTARWAEQDAALEAEWRTMAIGSAQPGYRPEGYDLGYGSAHGSIEARMMLAPPRNDAGQFVLEELSRRGGREWEGRLVRVVASDFRLTRYEIRLGIRLLVDPDEDQGEPPARVERVRSEEPTWLEAEDAEMTEKQRQARRDWSGWDLRLLGAGNRRKR